MYRLRLLNVDRIVGTEKEKNELISKGFKEIEETKETAEIPDYDNMTVDDLKTLAKQNGVSGYSNMKKDELIAVLKADSGTESEEK